MRIAILGTRGIPNRYGGFEAFAENLSATLTARGHQVSVYCRRAFTRPGDENLIASGVRRVILPSIPGKHLDTPIHTLLSALHVIGTKAEVILMCNAGNSPVAWIPRLFGKPVLLNVDGLDRARRKWNRLARAYLRFCEALSVITPTRVVTDSLANQAYFRSKYKKETAMIGYGAGVPPRIAAQPLAESVLARFSLAPRRYILYVSRLEPENNPELVIQAYRRLKTDWPLVMVGANPYDRAYVEGLHRLGGAGVIFTGAIYGDGYWQLQLHAGIFVFACEIGGIHPALIESMIAGNPTLYLDTPSNRETADDSAVIFSPHTEDLAARMQALLASSDARAQLGRRARERAEKLYGWAPVTDQYEKLLWELKN